MKEQYIKQVARELSVPQKNKREVIRDLDEVFASALENGETEQQVAKRLGSPKDFAKNVEEQLGLDMDTHKKRTRLMHIICTFAVAVISFIVCYMIQIQQIPKNAIGQADAMTSIRIAGSVAFDVTTLILIVGIAAFIFAVVQGISFLRKK